MLSDARIVGFVDVSSYETAREFYVSRLGLRLVAEDTFALAYETGGNMIRLSEVEQVMPKRGTVLGWSVPDIADVVSHLHEQGVAFARFDGLDQDSLGIWDSPDGAKVAWFRDPDGNLLSLTQFP